MIIKIKSFLLGNYFWKHQNIIYKNLVLRNYAFVNDQASLQIFLLLFWYDQNIICNISTYLKKNKNTIFEIL